MHTGAYTPCTKMHTQEHTHRASKCTHRSIRTMHLVAPAASAHLLRLQPASTYQQKNTHINTHLTRPAPETNAPSPGPVGSAWVHPVACPLQRGQREAPAWPRAAAGPAAQAAACPHPTNNAGRQALQKDCRCLRKTCLRELQLALMLQTKQAGMHLRKGGGGPERGVFERASTGPFPAKQRWQALQKD
eukprot:1161294-Pelagomonas_calceolata.AAC.5